MRPSARSSPARPDSPTRCSRSDSSSWNASASSSRHRRLKAAVTATSSRARATTCSRSARPSANGELAGSRSPPRTSTHTSRCGRCATPCAVTNSQTDVSSSGWTSPASELHERYWLLLEHGEAEICKTYPGLDEDLYITADAEAFVKWHAGQLAWAEATRDSRIHSTVPHGSYGPSRPGTAAACSPTSGPTAPPRAPVEPSEMARLSGTPTQAMERVGGEAGIGAGFSGRRRGVLRDRASLNRRSGAVPTLASMSGWGHSSPDVWCCRTSVRRALRTFGAARLGRRLCLAMSDERFRAWPTRLRGRFGPAPRRP